MYLLKLLECSCIQFIKYLNSKILDYSKRDDIQDLLIISDILISDYSSVVFDFGLTKKPCFLFIPDIIEYLFNERDLYFNISDLPFPHVEDSDSLVALIGSHDTSNYLDKLQEFYNQLGSFENGKATEEIVNHLLNQVILRFVHIMHETSFHLRIIRLGGFHINYFGASPFFISKEFIE